MPKGQIIPAPQRAACESAPRASRPAGGASSGLIHRTIPKSTEAVQALVMRAGIVVNVTRADRGRLEAIISDRSAPQKHVWRAAIILATADGCGTAEIMRRSGKSKPVVWRWQGRFMAQGVEGLTRDRTRNPDKKPLPAATVQNCWPRDRRRGMQPTGPAGCWRRRRA